MSEECENIGGIVVKFIDTDVMRGFKIVSSGNFGAASDWIRTDASQDDVRKMILDIKRATQTQIRSSLGIDY